MGRLGGLAVAKGTEALLLVTLWDAYGQAHNVFELWELFCAQPELSRIGTVACIVIIAGLFAATAATFVAVCKDGVVKVIESARGKVAQAKQDAELI